MKKILPLIFISIVALGLFLRFNGLTSNPPGFYVDEASIAENAYHISKSATDEWGIYMPVYFKAFGEYKNPLFIYSLIPLFEIMNPSIFSSRLGSAIWGLITVVFIGLLAKEVTNQTKLGLLGACIALFLPWHFFSSRIALEAISMPFFFTISLIFIVKYLKNHQFHDLWFAVIFTGLMFYSYTSARLLSPLLFLAIIVISIKKHSHRLFLTIALYGIILMPAIVWNQTTGGSLFVRYEQIKGLGFRENLTTYFHQFDPQLWLGSGDTNLHHTPSKGLLLITYLPLFLAGIHSLIKKGRDPLSILIIFILVTAPIPAALTDTDPNALRMIHLIPILVLLIVMGIKKLLSIKTSLKPQLMAVLFLTILIEHSLFFYNFHFNFPKQSQWWFDDAFVNLIPELNNYPDPIWIHHYLLNQSHQTTYNFICRTNPDCSEKTLNFSEKADIFQPNSTNIYFGFDCQTIKSSQIITNIILENPNYCVYQ